MKYLNILILLLVVISCKAQSNIVPIGSGNYIKNNSNYYLKDINNEFDKFEGTWIYTVGNKEITLRLKKETQYQTSVNGYYQDLLVGEYKYIINNIEVVNSLTDFNHPNISGYGHNIAGYNFYRRLPENCIDYSSTSEIKIGLNIKQPNNQNIEGRIILRHLIVNGVEKLQACIYDETVFSYGDNDRIAIPDGYYEFIKQD